MEKSIISLWDKHKKDLENYFKNTEQSEYSDYEKIVKAIFREVINKGETVYNLGSLTVIDDGAYQGTTIFIIPEKTYQPGIENYLMTHTYYGSCSGCDTLQGINAYDSGLPTELQVKEYMTLALHLVQKLKPLGRYQDDTGEYVA